MINRNTRPGSQFVAVIHQGFVLIITKEGKIMTILTEFGPPDYLPTLPYTRQPLANQWDINVFMLKELKKRYA